jgi:sigma-E factor negative regulatory protein RseA
MVMDGISALMDGELEDKEAQRLVAQLKSDEQSRERWDEFHLIGDALRGEPLLSAGFSEKFVKRLAEEPTVLAPRRFISKPRRVATYAMSAAASLAAAAFVASVALQPAPKQIAGPVPESVPGPLVVPAAEVQLATVPDARVNDFMWYHSGSAPSMQGVAAYVRVSTTAQAR